MTRMSLLARVSIDLNIWRSPVVRQQLVNTVLEQGEVYEYETENITKSGSVKILSISATIFEVDGRKCLISYSKDITEKRKAEESLRKIQEELEYRIKERTEELVTINEELTRENIERSKAEIALRESEEKYRTLFTEVPIGVYRTTLDGKFLQANPAVAKILGVESINDLMDMSVYDFYASSQSREELIKKQKQIKGIVYAEIELIRRDGKTIWVRDNGKVILNDKDEVECISGTIEDITKRKETQLALQDSEKRYRLLFENLHDIFFRIDENRNLILASPSAMKVTGYSVNELVGMNITDLIAEEGLIDDFKKKIDISGSINNYIMPFKVKNGSVIFLSVDAHVYFDKDDTNRGIEGIARDITSDIKYNNFLQTLYDISKAINSADSLYDLYSTIHTSLNNIIDARNFYIALFDNKKNLIRFPYVADEYHSNVPDADINEPNLLTPKIIRTGEPFYLNVNNVYEYKSRLGNDIKGPKPLVWLGVPLKLKHEIIGAIVVQSYDNPNLYSEDDITLLQPVADQIAFAIDRKRTAISMDFQLHFLQNLIDTIPNPVYYKDAETRRYLGCNRAFETMRGLRKEQIIGKLVEDLFPAELSDTYVEYDNELLQHKGVQNFETRVKHADGSMHESVFYKSCYRDSEGEVAGIVGIILDISDRKKAEMEIKSAQEYAELIYKVTPSSIFTIDKDRNITSWNERIASLTGFTSEDVIGKPCNLCHEAEEEGICPILENSSKMPVFGKECKIKTKNGNQRIISKNMDILIDANGDIMGGIESFDDITGRKRIEEALYWQAGVNSAVAELSKAIMSLPSMKDICELILEHGVKLTSSVTGFIGLIDPEKGHMTVPAVTKDLEQSSDFNINKKVFQEYSGAWGWTLRNRRAIIINSPATDPRSYESTLWNTSLRRFISAPAISGKKLVGIIALANSNKDYSEHDIEILERLTSLFSVALQRIQAENEIRSALEKEQELNELKSRFISMVSHEYRTPLTAIVLATELLSEYDDRMTKPDKLQYFDRIKRSVATMNTLLDDIISFNKVELNKVDFNPQYIDLEKLCLSITHEMELMAKDKCELDLTINNGDILANIDEKLVRKILINLLSNAIKYSNKNTKVEFIVTATNNEIEFIIKDSGIGMSEETKAKLFDPFFRGKNVGNISGTGLGLAIVQNSVEIHQGTLHYESELNQGTTFVITIPYYQKSKISKAMFKREINNN